MNGATFIAQCQIFAGLDRRIVSELARAAQEKVYDEGMVLFTEGEDASALHIVMDGRVDLIKTSAEGREQHIRSVASGEMFAEAAMFSGEAYPVTAMARSRSRVLYITKDRLKALVAAHPEIALAVMGTMAKLLRHLNELASGLALGSVQSRLAAYLIKRSREAGSLVFKLGLAKRELAVQLGTVPETLSRNLTKMKKQGVIAVRGETITINDIKALEKRSSN